MNSIFLVFNLLKIRYFSGDLTVDIFFLSLFDYSIQKNIY